MDNLRQGDEVLYFDDDVDLWLCSRIVRFKDSDKGTRVELSGPRLVQLDIQRISPLPMTYRATSSSPSSSSTMRTKTECDGNSSGCDESEVEEILSIGPICPGKKAKSFESVLGLAGWEKHTKGFGSKMLSKMGYERGLGLGKKCQGVATPMESVVGHKPLPSGLGLDFVRQHIDGVLGGAGAGCGAEGGEHGESGGAPTESSLKRRRPDLPPDPAPSRRGSGKSKVVEGSVFDFLNTIGPPPKSTSGSGGGGGSGFFGEVKAKCEAKRPLSAGGGAGGRSKPKSYF